MDCVVYRARRILTLDPGRPEATHVAVRDGRVLGVGSLDDLRGWGPHELDERFADQVLMPGLVEGHTHLLAGAIWRFVYCGSHDTHDPDGRPVTGLRTRNAVVEALRERARSAEPGTPINGWGFDPLLLQGEATVNRSVLDAVSTERPVTVLHGSGHVLYANSVALRETGLLQAGIDLPGVLLGADGVPVGELRGPEAMNPLFVKFGVGRVFGARDVSGIEAFGRLATRAGVTTATDLGTMSGRGEIATLRQVTDRADFPVRLVSALIGRGMSPADMLERVLDLRAQGTDRLRLGSIKLVADGSIQGFSARLRWPGYFNGAPNGLWYLPPDTVRDVFERALQHGVQVHVHTNGDEAVDMVLDAMEAALRRHPSPDHRFTLQHCQLADAAQFRRMRALGVCANLFINHVYYWGEAHRASTVGPDRAERMNACRTALDTGVVFAVHSDAPITPMAPLFSAWCAVNRLTHAGRVLGAHQRIGVADALRAVTLGAARTLKLDHEIGSIECGKRADFCVLDDDPLDVDPQRLKDVRVWGTVSGGRVFPADSAARAEGASS